MFTRSSSPERKATPSVQPDLTVADERCTPADSQAQAIGQLDIAELELQEIKRVLRSVIENSRAD
jgi:hypothetical protein